VSWSHPAWEDLARLIGQRTGLTFEQRRDSAEQGMRQAMVRARMSDAAAYRDLIAANEEALNDLVSELTVGETYFFREPAQFQRIRSEWLPAIRGKRGPGHTPRIWSAGCASGEEAYSLAIVLDQEGMRAKAHILGTDISHKALAKARRGLYGEWSLRGEGRMALPYLQPVGKEFRLAEHIRRRVTFEHQNLALDTYPSLHSGIWGMDLILCRNVLIYFDRETIRRVARQLYQTLAPGGWLMTASSDPFLWDDAPFEVLARAEEGLVYERPMVGSQESGIRGQASVTSGQWPVASGQWAEELFESPANEGLPDRTAPADSRPLATDHWPLAKLDIFREAQKAYGRGDYATVVEMLENETNPEVVVLRMRALSNLDVAGAEQACAEATTRYPLSTELHYVQAVLLLNLGRTEEAARALRRVLYLDRSLAVVHFTLGTLLRATGEREGARRAFRNAREQCVQHPAEDALPLGEGETAGRLAELAAFELSLLEGVP
jgi:chemotaxis protein methyltransferase CheR